MFNRWVVLDERTLIPRPLECSIFSTSHPTHWAGLVWILSQLHQHWFCFCCLLTSLGFSANPFTAVIRSFGSRYHLDTKPLHHWWPCCPGVSREAFKLLDHFPSDLHTNSHVAATLVLPAGSTLATNYVRICRLHARTATPWAALAA